MNEQKKFNLDKYVNALNDLLGVDHAYFSGDENVEALVELIVMAKNLAYENEVLRNTLLALDLDRKLTEEDNNE